MITVWVLLQSWDREGGELYGLFGTAELAKEHIKKIYPSSEIVWKEYHDGSFYGDGNFMLYPMIVDNPPKESISI